MKTPPRSVFPIPHVQEAEPEQLIVKYMSWGKFKDLVERSSIYFRRIDGFRDLFEGNIPLAVWELNNPVLKDWYNRCKREIFVTCWNMDPDETPEMWKEYAEGHGVRISSTVGALTAELSSPALPPQPPSDPNLTRWAQQAGGQLAELDERSQDGFTLGKIKYIDFDNIDVYEVLGEGPSNTVPAFRKRSGYVNEHEFRAILRPGSISGETASARGDMHAFVPVRLQNLIQEIRFAPVNDAALQRDIEERLTRSGLTIPVPPASLGIIK